MSYNIKAQSQGPYNELNSYNSAFLLAILDLSKKVYLNRLYKNTKVTG